MLCALSLPVYAVLTPPGGSLEDFDLRHRRDDRTRSMCRARRRHRIGERRGNPSGTSARLDHHDDRDYTDSYTFSTSAVCPACNWSVPAAAVFWHRSLIVCEPAAAKLNL